MFGVYLLKVFFFLDELWASSFSLFSYFFTSFSVTFCLCFSHTSKYIYFILLHILYVFFLILSLFLLHLACWIELEKNKLSSHRISKFSLRNRRIWKSSLRHNMILKSGQETYTFRNSLNLKIRLRNSPDFTEFWHSILEFSGFRKFGYGNHMIRNSVNSSSEF